jgi:phosphatidylglycerophosphatase C
MNDGTEPGTPTVVAAFDVDGTLTTRDCVQPFLELLGGRRGIATALLRVPHRSLVAMALLDRDRMKDVVVGGVFSGRDVVEVDEHGHRFAQRVFDTMLRPDTVARVRWHQAQGHRTVIVSASLRSYLEPLAALLGIEHALCTDVVSEAGRYGSSLLGPNCRGPEKAVRLRRWIADENIEHPTIWAYGDSAGDRELLAMADHAVWVKGTTVTAVPEQDQR